MLTGALMAFIGLRYLPRLLGRERPATPRQA